MRDHSYDRTMERNYLQKWRSLIPEYEAVKAGRSEIFVAAGLTGSDARCAYLAVVVLTSVWPEPIIAKPSPPDAKVFSCLSSCRLFYNHRPNQIYRDPFFSLLFQAKQ
jgi:hypothetical protein